MIKLTINEGSPQDRVIKGVRFVGGKAELPVDAYPRAKNICKFYNVSFTMEQDVPKPKETDPAGIEPGESEVGDEVVVEPTIESKPNLVP